MSPKPTNSDSLKQEILKVRTNVDQIQLNLATAHKKFKRGMVVATIGYSVTIAGGLCWAAKMMIWTHTTHRWWNYRNYRYRDDGRCI